MNRKGDGSLIISILIIIGVLIYLFNNPNSLHPDDLFGKNLTVNNVSITPVSSSIYPNLTLTPGDVMETNLSIICVTGYTTTVRDVPESLRKQAFERYGISYPPPSYSYELDHLISLELGGSNNITNLFPEAYEPKPGAREKDVVENYLHKQVCDGLMSLEDAQYKIVHDWYAVYQEIKK